MPVDSACFAQDASGMPCIEFACKPARSISTEDDLPKVVLEDLAVLIRRNDNNQLVLKSEEIVGLAAESGPLFVHRNASTLNDWNRGVVRESMTDWQNVINVARWAVLTQEMLNGAGMKPDSIKQIEKTHLVSIDSGNEFDLYTLAFPLGTAGFSDYCNSVPQRPWFRKFSQDNAFDYAVLVPEVDEGSAYLNIYLLSFQKEPTTSDFAAIVGEFSDDPSVMQVIFDAYRTTEGIDAEADSFGLLSTEDNLVISSADVTKEDFPHLQRLVYALTSVHLQGVRVDVFNSTEGEDFMVFDSFLSFLWYTFAKQASNVKIGYCQECGKGFPLTNHRGIKRRFCCEGCKTDAKNKRMRNRDLEIRESFLDGESVTDLALRYYPDKLQKDRREAILGKLRNWRVLQHAREDAVVLRDAESLNLVRRCIEEDVWTKEEFTDFARQLDANPRKKREIKARAKKR